MVRSRASGSRTSAFEVWHRASESASSAASERTAARHILSAVTAFEPPGVAWTRDATRGETGDEPHLPGKDIPHGTLTRIYRQAGWATAQVVRAGGGGVPATRRAQPWPAITSMNVAA